MATIQTLSWEQREAHLQEIKRYHKFMVMLYRTNNLIHTKRVLRLLQEIFPEVKHCLPTNFNLGLAEHIALYHDDIELVLKDGDIPLQEKLRMNQQKLLALKQEEFEAVEILSKNYPSKLGRFTYKEVLLHSVRKDCAEAQIVSFVDKIDGLCEAIHEVLAGNAIFLEPVINYYNKTFNSLLEKYPLIQDVFREKDSWFSFDSVVSLKDFFEEGTLRAQPHTLKNLKLDVGIPQYHKWRDVTITHFGIDPLIKQVEFF